MSPQFYETFPKEEAETLLKKIDFYYTPTHGSWLNMAEIEINIMSNQCLGDRIGDEQTLNRQLIICKGRLTFALAKVLGGRFMNDSHVIASRTQRI